MASRAIAYRTGERASVPLKFQEGFNVKKKRILAMILAVVSCLSLAVGASAANTTTRKAADFRDYDDAARVVQMGTYNGRCSMFRPWPAETTCTAEANSSLRRRNIKGSVLIRTDSGFLDTKRKNPRNRAIPLYRDTTCHPHARERRYPLPHSFCRLMPGTE